MPPSVRAESEGEEGKYYIWSEAEIDAALAGTFSARFKQVYGVTRDGNFRGRNLRAGWAMSRPPTKPMKCCWPSSATCCWRRALKRQRPRATKACWRTGTGLAIAALARAGTAFDQRRLGAGGDRGI